jgi:glycerophosphoryl diester phosphodiesterase
MQRRKLVVAHRGDHAKAHENTVAAFQAAIDDGADAIELDVRRTADGRLVVHHDECIGDERIADLPFSRASGLALRLGYRLAQLDEARSSLRTGSGSTLS